MANYIIIGGDGKEYGPISADDLRHWITEGRLNAQSLVKAESDAEFRPLEKFPDFADAFGKAAPLQTAADYQDRDYELDIMGCVSRGWDLFKSNFGILFAGFLLFAVITIVFSGMVGGVVALLVPKKLLAIAAIRTSSNLVISAVTALVIGPLAGGFYLVYLKILRGQPTNVGEMFAGFQKCFGQLFLGYLVVVLATGLCMAPFSYVSAAKTGPLLLQMQTAQPTEVQNLLPQLLAAFTSTLPLLLICLVPVTYLTVNWLFTQALIIDKQMDFGTALKTSWRAVHKHWWQVFGLVVVTGLINVGGILLCCVGVAITFPIVVAALMFAYETIFGAEKN